MRNGDFDEKEGNLKCDEDFVLSVRAGRAPNTISCRYRGREGPAGGAGGEIARK